MVAARSEPRARSTRCIDGWDGSLAAHTAVQACLIAWPHLPARAVARTHGTTAGMQPNELLASG